jgi:putative chitinase
MAIITGSILKQICTTLKDQRAIILANELDICATKYGFNTADSLHEFIAQVVHESGEFTIKAENMNYRTPSLLMANWPKHFPSVDFAKKYCGDPVKLGNYIYGSTSIAKDLGNIKPEDGYNFRGSGYLQLTGRDSATQYQKYAGIDTVEHAADLLRTDDHYAMDAAGWEFAVNKKLIPLTLVNTPEAFIQITRKINGGTIGLQDRIMYYQRAKQYLK